MLTILKVSSSTTYHNGTPSTPTSQRTPGSHCKRSCTRTAAVAGKKGGVSAFTGLRQKKRLQAPQISYRGQTVIPCRLEGMHSLTHQVNERGRSQTLQLAWPSGTLQCTRKCHTASRRWTAKPRAWPMSRSRFERGRQHRDRKNNLGCAHLRVHWSYCATRPFCSHCSNLKQPNP